MTMEKATMTVPEVAKILNCSQQKVRMHIRLGIWKFGECIPKEKTKKKTDTFVIYTRKFKQHIGEE